MSNTQSVASPSIPPTPSNDDKIVNSVSNIPGKSSIVTEKVALPSVLPAKGIYHTLFLVLIYNLRSTPFKFNAEFTFKKRQRNCYYPCY
jgi:hypothetical protein